MICSGLLYAPPPSVVYVSPGQSLATLAGAASTGQVFAMLPGTHRLTTVTPKNNQVFRGLPGSLISGATLLSNWTVSGPQWFANAAPSTGNLSSGGCQGGMLCEQIEDLYIDGVDKTPVATQAAATAGKYFYDRAAQKVYVGDNPIGHVVEWANEDKLFIGGATKVLLQDLVIEKFSPGAQNGAIMPSTTGFDWRAERCEVRQCHGIGIFSRSRFHVRSCFLHHNGQMGIGGCGQLGAGDDILVEDNEIAFNNTKGYSPGWEAGAQKFAFTLRLIYAHNNCHHNFGHGAWWDIENRDYTIAENWVHDNDFSGIFAEISP